MASTNRRRRPEVADPLTPRPDWVVAALAVVGALVAGYLSWVKFSGGGAVLCVAGGGCDLVQASRYARLLGVPTALWGFAMYVAIGVLALMGLQGRRWLAAFLLAAGGVGFSIYLTALSVFEIGATCTWCLTSGVIAIGILAAVLRRRPGEAGRKAALTAPRLATYGVLVAVATVVAGAFVFAAPFSDPPGYRHALARHLTETHAVMYGAFW